jgi:hypothetical protein
MKTRSQMFLSFCSRLRRRPAIVILFAGILLSCSSGHNSGLVDVRNPDDSIVLGRLRFVPGTNCTGEFRIPTFQLQNTTDGSTIPFAAASPIRLIAGRNIEIPIAQKTNPGILEFRIKAVEAPPQSAWLDPGYISLIEFAVAPGQLVYFGTMEVDIECHRWERQSATRCVQHRIRDESDREITLFREEFPEIFQIYKSRIKLDIPKTDE